MYKCNTKSSKNNTELELYFSFQTYKTDVYMGKLHTYKCRLTQC